MSAPFVLLVTIDHGSVKKGEATREVFTLERDRLGVLTVIQREVQR